MRQRGTFARRHDGFKRRFLAAQGLHLELELRRDLQFGQAHANPAQRARVSLGIGNYAAANQRDLGGRFHGSEIFDKAGNGMQRSAGRESLLEAAILLQVHPGWLESYFPEMLTLDDRGSRQDQWSFGHVRLAGDGRGDLGAVAWIGEEMRFAGRDQHQPVRSRVARQITDVRGGRYDQRFDFVGDELFRDAAAPLFDFSQTYSLANPAVNFRCSWN